VSRRAPGWLERVLAEYHRLAAECTSDAEIAQRLGVGVDALQSARARLRARGHAIPTAQEMRDPAREELGELGGSVTDREDFEAEEPTQPGVEARAPWVMPGTETWCLTPGKYCPDCFCDYCKRRRRELEARAPRTIEDDLADRRDRAEVASLKSRLKSAIEQLEQCRYELGIALDVQAAYRDPPPIEPRERMGGKREATAFAMASDWHIEETVDKDAVNGVNEFNLEIARRRVRRFFDGFCFLTNYHRDHFLIRDSKLWLGGDLITGYLREEDLESNSLAPVQAIAELEGWIVQGVRQYLDEVPVERLDLDCSSGNHGRLTEKIRPRTREANSLEWLLYHHLAREFRDESRVNVTLPRGAHNYAKIYDLIIRETHGDGTKGGNGIGGIMIPIRRAIARWQTVRHAHLTIMGHWHQEHFLSDLHINGSLVGYGPYSLSIPAPFEHPRQSFFLVDKQRGVSMPATIWLDDSMHEMVA
jgi:hypothetical protein